MKSLVGMFVWYNDDDYHRNGHIVDAIDDETYLVHMDWNDTPDDVDTPLEVIGIMEMATATTSDGQKKWHLFQTIQQRARFLKWLESPSKPARVISMVKKPPD